MFVRLQRCLQFCTSILSDNYQPRAVVRPFPWRCGSIGVQLSMRRSEAVTPAFQHGVVQVPGGRPLSAPIQENRAVVDAKHRLT